MMGQRSNDCTSSQVERYGTIEAYFNRLHSRYCEGL